MRTIFLDIDGVLCLDGINIDASLLRNLCSLVDDDVDVVLTSTWRLYPESLIRLKSMFAKRGISNIGVTENFEKTRSSPSQSRVLEILDWLKWHPEIDQWVIIDDDDLTEKSQGHKSIDAHFVLTEFNFPDPTGGGLNDEKLAEAKAVLEAVLDE